MIAYSLHLPWRASRERCSIHATGGIARADGGVVISMGRHRKEGRATSFGRRGDRCVLLVLPLVLAGCSSDWMPFASGELEGELAPVPADWSHVADASVIQLETNPAEPYSVNLWIIAMGDALYVHAGANRATWVEHIEADPRVRLGYDGNIYALRATRVTETHEFERFSAIYRDKYGNYPRNRDVEQAYLYRLVPRH